VTDGQVPAQWVKILLCEHLRNQSHPFVKVGYTSITGRDAGALLPAMLQRVQAKEGQAGDVHAVRMDAKHATRLARRIIPFVHSTPQVGDS
jgi:hypothetical protein